MSRSLYGIKGKEAIKVFVRVGGIEKPGKGDHINIKMPNGVIVTIPGHRPGEGNQGDRPPAEWRTGGSGRVMEE